MSDEIKDLRDELLNIEDAKDLYNFAWDLIEKLCAVKCDLLAEERNESKPTACVHKSVYNADIEAKDKEISLLRDQLSKYERMKRTTQ